MITKKKLDKLKKDFDWKFYVSNNRDLNHIINKKDAWNHFKNFGYSENRLYNKKNIAQNVYDFFDWKFYVSFYSDLKHITNKKKAWEHYLNHGINEKRHINPKYVNIDKNFDWKFYVSFYPDLRYIKNKYEAIDHYLNHGISEKRYINIECIDNKKNTILQQKKHIENNLIENNLIEDSFKEGENYILVVMPTYNRSDYILKSIDYIKNQTYKYWRFLIIDDGSDQNNKANFNELKKKLSIFNKVIFLENDINCQVAKTLNKGIEYFLNNNKFTHFTWVSDDNEYYPNFLQDLVSNNNYFKYTSYDIQELNETICTNSKNYKDFNDILNNFSGCGSFMWTREAIQKIGLYNETVPGCEDFEYLLRTFKINENNCIFSDIPTMKYIRHDNSLMEMKKDIIMNIKNQIVIDFRLKSINKISYIEYPDLQYYLYYNNKTNLIINIIKKIKSIKIDYVKQYSVVFDTNLTSFSNNIDIENLTEYFKKIEYDKIYIFNELDYCHLKAYYQINDNTREILINFLKKSLYLITFTEIFENDNLQTVGNTSFNKEYSTIFFKYAYKSFLCDSQNINYLYNNLNIKNNILYHPPITFEDSLKKTNNQDIDILFYGSMNDSIFSHRSEIIKKISDFALEKNYVFKFFNRNLYGEEKDNILKRSKIVVHIPSLPNLRTIPWAKISELMMKEVFFITENNVIEYERHQINLSSYDIFYENKKIKSTNICEVIQFYLQNPDIRNKSILRNKQYILRYHNNDMFKHIFNYKDYFVLNKKTIKNINNVIAFKYGSYSFHHKFNNQYKNFIEKKGIKFHYYNEEFTNMFGEYYNIYFSNIEIFDKYIGCCEDYKENYNSFFVLKEKFNNFLSNYEECSDNLYLFNAEDLMGFFYYYDATNYEKFYKFINSANYIIFQYEVIENENLLTIGFINSEMLFRYCFDFDIFERTKFLKDIYLNSKITYICDTKNKYYLESNGIKNLKYMVPYIDLPFRNLNMNKPIDCLFYGSIFEQINDSYRNIIIKKIQTQLSELITFTTCKELFDEELINKINCSKIILHIPSHDNLRTMPWAKISYLMVNKIFFIIEENDELFNLNLENTIIYYKRGDINDLKTKIIQYKDNDTEKQKITDKCYKYFTENFDKTKLLEDII